MPPRASKLDPAIALSSDRLTSLLRDALDGRTASLERAARQMATSSDPATISMSRAIRRAIDESNAPSGPFRSDTLAAVPVDIESRAELVRSEYPVVLESVPLWSPQINKALVQVVEERKRITELHSAGLSAAGTALFHGPPGCGKTLAARWLAASLGVPLFILDLAAVMSSFLGRTGTNVRNVLEYARGMSCVLLLDEIDAIAKRRDDDVEIGELKRLVTVLLQQLDDWPERALLVGASNHPELLDRALWRRFDVLIQFEMPNEGQIRDVIISELLHETHTVETEHLLSAILSGVSFSDARREVRRLRRDALLRGRPIDEVARELFCVRVHEMPREQRHQVAKGLQLVKKSQREIQELTGVSRDTLRKFTSVHSSEEVLGG